MVWWSNHRFPKRAGSITEAQASWPRMSTGSPKNAIARRRKSCVQMQKTIDLAYPYDHSETRTMKLRSQPEQVFLPLLVVLILSNYVIEHAVAIERPTKPNVVLILTDDLGWQDVGCTTLTNPALSTPPISTDWPPVECNFFRDTPLPRLALHLVLQSCRVNIQRVHKKLTSLVAIHQHPMQKTASPSNRGIAAG